MSGIASDCIKNSTRSFAAYNKDAIIRERSSSGGLFYSFAKSVIDEGGLVFGASFDKDWQVFHKGCTTMDNVEGLMQSKYVQSDINNSYKLIKEALALKRKVLFCGTPCQVYGLLSYLEVNKISDLRNNLITIDFICHGVPSRMVWRKYLKEISQGKEIKHINFRDKTNGWRDFSLKIDYTDGTSYFMSWLKDPYVQGFIKNLYLRQSCYECKFRGIERASDFTIADFWSVYKIIPEIFDDRGTSILMVHNEYAMDFLKKIENEFCLCEIANETVASTNTPAVTSVPKNPNRSIFFNNINKKKLSKVIVATLQVSLLTRIKRKIVRILNI